ncbi:BamA/TamA family outer membrane protein [uncultured Dokdonia sp.]|uniref:BamA/TamA family outer membrane protein n=1 Tax=uncultured Dokdonia sp. TaxID=575653 RepID=UPI00262D649C|nr:BamA/TamA family outer membrane protein [uncultured Dokdonia sp.]
MKLISIRTTILLALIVFNCQFVQSQNLEKIAEFFTFYPNKKAHQKDSALYLQKFIAAPVMTYSPETNLAIGTGAKYLFKFNGSGEETRASNIPMSIRYTLNNQFIFYSGFEVFTNQEKWVIEGNLLFQNYPRLFYGIGRDSPKENELEYNYYQFLFEPIFLKQMFTRYLFIGAGIRYNTISNVAFEEEEAIAVGPDAISGFNGSTSSGVEAAVLYDSRNNILNAENGWYIEATYGVYGKALGGTHSFELTRFDVRHFLGLSENGQDILGFQLLGSFSSGDVPFNELALLGGNEIMRGYREGRYVDRHLVAGQMEYRKSFGDSRWGAVAFVGAGDVANRVPDFKLSNFRPNYGAGVRFKLDKTENLNLRFDYGFGQNSNYFYFTIAEAF